MVKYSIHAQGLEQAIVRHERMAAAAVDATPAMASVAALMMGFIERTFHSGGRRGGGSWAQITDEWLTRKVRNGLDPRIGYATHALVESLTVLGAAGQELEITPQSVRLASHLPYAATQQRHRPFVKFTPTDHLRIRDTVRNHLIAAWISPI